MKVQEVRLRAKEHRIRWFQAGCRFLAVTDRHQRRWREQYEHGGSDGLLERRRCRPSEKRMVLEHPSTRLTYFLGDCRTTRNRFSPTAPTAHCNQ